MKLDDMLGYFVVAAFVIAIIGSFFGWSIGTIDGLIGFATLIFTSFFISGIVGTILEGLGGGFLKGISFAIPIGPFRFSISAFVVAVFVLKNWIF